MHKKIVEMSSVKPVYATTVLVITEETDHAKVSATCCRRRNTCIIISCLVSAVVLPIVMFLAINANRFRDETLESRDETLESRTLLTWNEKSQQPTQSNSLKTKLATMLQREEERKRSEKMKSSLTVEASANENIAPTTFGVLEKPAVTLPPTSKPSTRRSIPSEGSLITRNPLTTSTSTIRSRKSTTWKMTTMVAAPAKSHLKSSRKDNHVISRFSFKAQAAPEDRCPIAKEEFSKLAKDIVMTDKLTYHKVYKCQMSKLINHGGDDCNYFSKENFNRNPQLPDWNKEDVDALAIYEQLARESGENLLGVIQDFPEFKTYLKTFKIFSNKFAQVKTMLLNYCNLTLLYTSKGPFMTSYESLRTKYKLPAERAFVVFEQMEQVFDPIKEDFLKRQKCLR